MNTEKLLLIATLLAILVFSTSFALLWTVGQAITGSPNETRRQALIATLASMQETDGSFSGIPQTVDTLAILKCLNSSDSVNVTKAIDYLVFQQNATTGGFPADYLTIYGELHTPFNVLNTLESFESIHMLNRTNLVNFVMLRYNETDGAFHEPTFELNGEKIAWCHFPITGMGWGDRDNYGESNIISTFLAVDILRNLDAFDRINITKTIDFIRSCRTANGGFGPYPNAHSEPFISSWMTHSFTVDSYGAGVAYTYCAVGALSDLGSLDSFTEAERQQTIGYMLSCQHNRTGCFVSIPEYASDPGSSPEDHNTFFTYYAVIALKYLNAIDQTKENVIKAEKWFLTIQNPDNELIYELVPIGGAYDFIMCMNASHSFYLLDALTSRALGQRTIFFGISTAAGFTTFSVAVVTPYAVKRIQRPKQNDESCANLERETT